MEGYCVKCKKKVEIKERCLKVNALSAASLCVEFWVMLKSIKNIFIF